MTLCPQNWRTPDLWLGRWVLVAQTLLVAHAIPMMTLARPLGNFTVNPYADWSCRRAMRASST